jgi:hypothetical protein
MQGIIYPQKTKPFSPRDSYEYFWDFIEYSLLSKDRSIVSPLRLFYLKGYTTGHWNKPGYLRFKTDFSQEAKKYAIAIGSHSSNFWDEAYIKLRFTLDYTDKIKFILGYRKNRADDYDGIDNTTVSDYHIVVEDGVFKIQVDNDLEETGIDFENRNFYKFEMQYSKSLGKANIKIYKETDSGDELLIDHYKDNNVNTSRFIIQGVNTIQDSDLGLKDTLYLDWLYIKMKDFNRYRTRII